ncbi:E3 ubiquitin-protein ligase RNF14-like [Periplaneta americana]|uniref:E3 ubiquitin-protein ligase RNF14-like n=1 Tax=Periplaneta americana TaxID=6978 RepID=UPI0037E7EBB8
MSDKESQKDEICALQSIFNEEELQTHEENGLLEGHFHAYIELPNEFKVIFRDLRQEDSSFQEFLVKHLPPVSLHFSLPHDYPSHSPPTYRLSCQWLQNNKIMLLRKKLDEIWKENEGTEVIFLWTQFLKEETLKYLQIIDTLDVSFLETAHLKHEEFKQAKRLRHMQAQQKKRDETCDNSKVNALVNDSNQSTAQPDVDCHSRRKYRGRPRWGKREKFVVTQDQQKTDGINGEGNGHKKTEVMSARTVYDNTGNAKVVFSNNRRGTYRQPRSYYRGNYRKGNNYNHCKSTGNKVTSTGDSECNSKSDFTKSSEKIVLNSKDQGKDNKNCESSLQCDNKVGQHCSNSNEKITVGNSSQDSGAESQKVSQNETVSDGAVKVSTSEDDKKDGERQLDQPDSSANRRHAGRSRMSLVQLLKEFNEARQRTEFSRNFYTCKICFQDKQGSQCTSFEVCGHVFCKSCVAEYFEVRIKDGSVHSICCPEEKCTSEAMPGQIRELVSAELFSRYDAVLLSALLDTMEDVLYCPRPVCQYPVAVEPGEKMATCPSCAYAFCILCKMVYHGIEPCRFRAHEKRRIVEEYSNASEERKLQMEQRYGKKQLQALVDTSLSENWLFNNSKKCPNCNAAIEKSDGCNKMVCWKCNTFFCWLCEGRLDPQTPYQHFNNPASKCYNLLFHGVPLSDDEDEEWWGAPPGGYLENDDDDDDDDD